tara:strand:+ start:793 stop:1179 length:387 start_codon:yes stop_codon:yes gene_type:complete
MSEKFTLEIISPDRQVIKIETSEVIIPAYEGEIGILKDHIPLITFLRPGLIQIQGELDKKYFVEDGTVEFANNNLLILTSTAKEIQELDKNLIDSIISSAENKLADANVTDKEKYLVSYKIDTLKNIN